MSRSPLLNGFRLVVRHPCPLLWVYALNVGIAWFASVALRTQFASVTSNSLAAQRLISGFDMGVVIDANRQLSDAPHGALNASMLAIPIYLLIYFLFIPGTLFAYQSGQRIKLSELLLRGVQSFWSFVRILIFTAVIGGILIGVASVAQKGWSSYLDEHVLGKPGWELQMLGAFVVFLVVCLVRLYFDLVEVHTVALAQTVRSDSSEARPDRRVRKTMRPALSMLKSHFITTYLGFVALALLAGVAVYLFGLSALHHLGQPRAWPTFLLLQLGLFITLFIRFWQRGMETTLFQNLTPPVVVVSPVVITSEPEIIEPVERVTDAEPGTSFASNVARPVV